MKRITNIVLSICFLLVAFSQNSFSADPALNVNCDIMSRYLWRGTDFGRSPSIQPKIEFSAYNFALGAWGAFTINGFNNQEADLYLSYTINSMFLVGVTDYFFPNDKLTNNNYYESDGDITGHVLELNVAFLGAEGFPLKAFFNYNMWGADKANSIYTELMYSSKIGENPFDVFMGFTTDQGIYGTSAGVVNLGITGYKNIKISQDYSLPVKCSFITNPQAENIHIVFGLSF